MPNCYSGTETRGHQVPGFNIYPRVCFRYVFDGFTRSPPHPTNKIRARVNTGGCSLSRYHFTRASEIRGQHPGEENSKQLGPEGMSKSYLLCPPKSSEASSFDFETFLQGKTLFGRAIAVLTTNNSHLLEVESS